MSEFTKGLTVQDTGHCETDLQFLISKEADGGDIEYFAWAYKKEDAHLIAACPTMFEYIKTKANSGCSEAKEIISKITLDS